MKSIARRVNVDHGLALNLYDTVNYDAMYLAGLIFDDVKMTARDLHKWAKNAHGTSLANYGLDGIREKIRLGAWIDVDWIKNCACRCLWMDYIGMLDDIETG